MSKFAILHCQLLDLSIEANRNNIKQGLDNSYRREQPWSLAAIASTVQAARGLLRQRHGSGLAGARRGVNPARHSSQGSSNHWHFSALSCSVLHAVVEECSWAAEMTPAGDSPSPFSRQNSSNSAIQPPLPLSQ